MSGRARGIPSRSAINVEYPYQVAVRDIEGQRLSGIRCSGSYSSLCQWRHTVGDGKHSYEVFCFGDATQVIPQPGIFPDYTAPIIRNPVDGGARELALARWGMPSPFFVMEKAAKARADKLAAKGKPIDMQQMLRMEPSAGNTNIRDTKYAHWRKFLDVPNRCLVPFTSFSEFNKDAGGDIWFAFGEERPTAFFAGVWTPQWRSVRKVKEGEVTADLYAFLTTDPNAEVKAIHPKAMPVILTTPEECETWMTAPWEQAFKLQRPLQDGSLRIVARGAKKDGPDG